MQCLLQFRTLAVAAVTMAALGASAAPVHLDVAAGPFAAGDTITLRAIDDNPSQMCSGGFCAADLRVGFDNTLVGAPQLGGFLSGLADASDMLTVGDVQGAGSSSAYVDITFFLLEDGAAGKLMPSVPTELFSLDFVVAPGTSGQFSFTVGMVDPTNPSYSFDDARSSAVTVTARSVPEPASLALVLGALGASAFVRRRRVATR